MFKGVNSVVRRCAVAVVGVSGAVAAPMTFAAGTGPDYTALTGGIDYTSTIAAVMAIAALSGGLWLAVRGAKIVLSMVRGA
ncbi:hypothetical protein LGM90_10150 [Burkholderia sp. AU28942]|uniref:hypothetical protein n=1 Tax=Burkholderia TaxID=32008 RepID=UPI000841636D|nr:MULTISPECIES: hypothetical protein [Burkholderia]MBR7964663.1 hypothetical protein [Burkholderia vietnamiensis]AOK07617.1 hypothetical protein WK25_24360 [Burkholderia latens]MCA8308869.1 hypothetical protein [Burkholderia sp. AU28942]QTO44853.1 hypothetical protein J8I85_12115 [Burkholderia latens]QTO46915.1 hypothetical protein J8I85_18925 [Burkholderia latens]